MIDYVLEYMARCGVYASSQKEQEMLRSGIAQYLKEIGIEDSDTGEFYKESVNLSIKRIDVTDLKLYFMYYNLISDVRQIVIYYMSYDDVVDCGCICSPVFEQITIEDKKKLQRLIDELHSCGLGEKYIPETEVHILLER